jgi:hypothetical protein
MFLSLIGATIRYIVDCIFNRNAKRKPWRGYWLDNYAYETDFIDKIIGGFVIVILICLVMLMESLL